MAGTILVIDDSVAIQKVIKIAFSKYKIHVVSVSSLDDAAKVFVSDEISFVVLGSVFALKLEQRVQLRSKISSKPAVVLLSQHSKGDQQKVAAQGFEEFVYKPFRPNDLVAIVRRMSSCLFEESSAKAGELSAPVNPDQTSVPSLPAAEQGKTEETFLPPLPAVGESQKQASSSSVSSSKNSIVSTVRDLDEEFSGSEPSKADLVETDLKDAGGQTVQIPLHLHEAKGTKAFASSYSNPTSPESLDSFADALSARAYKKLTEKMVEQESRGRGSEQKLSVSSESVVNELLEHPMTQKLIDQSVERFCRENFPEIARQVIESEVRRLAEEKSRLLMDI
jgi:CheY-like chemotaxis protein